MPKPKKKPGTYILILRSAAEQWVQVGRKGRFLLPTGYHVYVGSAFGPGGVARRLARHLGRLRRKHWHIDHLTSLLEVVEVWFSHDPQKRECVWSAIVGQMPGAMVPIERFGCSDCRSCVSHLYSFEGRPRLADFRRRLQAVVPGHAPLGRVKDVGVV
jgi:Uri superfamily endonuclease